MGITKRLLRYVWVIGCLLMVSSVRATDGVNTIRVSFFSESVDLRYHANLVLPGRAPMNEPDLVRYFQNLNHTDYRIFLADLRSAQSHYQLNDYLFYQLLHRSLEQIMPEASPRKRSLTEWFLLTKAGFDTRLTWSGKKVYLYVHTKDDLFEVPMIEEGGKIYVNLTSIIEQQDSQGDLYMLDFQPNRGGQSFGFELKQLPNLRPEFAESQLRFMYAGEWQTLSVRTDRTVREVMRSYPFVSEQAYVEAPLSTTVAGSLLPQLQKLIDGKSDREALELIVAFTRSGFSYREDKQHFGYSKPMIADEVFHYPYSDCEDRVALFYALTRELLDLPMLVVAYPDHLTVAVALNENIGPALVHGGRRYFFCDPTGPSNSDRIGNVPSGYEKQQFEVIGSYVGQR